LPRLNQLLGRRVNVVPDIYFLDAPYEGSDLVYWRGDTDSASRIPENLNPILDVAFFPDPQVSNDHVSHLQLENMSAYQKFQHYLLSARRCIDIAVYNLTDDRTRRVLEELHERGIRIRILTDYTNIRELGSDVQALANEGIEVRFIRAPTQSQHGLMHHKFAVIDNVFMLNGSFNWSRAAATVNQENIVFCNIPAMVMPFIDQFACLWETGCVLQPNWIKKKE